jgi:hypothetical protein
MVTNIVISFNKKDGRIQILEAEDSEDKKETVIEVKDLSKFIYEINLEAFVYFQQFDYTYSLYLLKKAEKVLTVGLVNEVFSSSSPEAKSGRLDDKVLVDNNIAFLYMKMGVADKSILQLAKCLDDLDADRSKGADPAKKSGIKPDFFLVRCEKIKYKKIKARLNLSLCILYSEKLQ